MRTENGDGEGEKEKENEKRRAANAKVAEFITSSPFLLFFCAAKTKPATTIAT